MRTIHMTPEMIGKTIKVEHRSDDVIDVFSGVLIEFSVITEPLYSKGLTRANDARFHYIKANISGVEFALQGHEQLTIQE